MFLGEEEVVELAPAGLDTVVARQEVVSIPLTPAVPVTKTTHTVSKNPKKFKNIFHMFYTGHLISNQFIDELSSNRIERTRHLQYQPITALSPKLPAHLCVHVKVVSLPEGGAGTHLPRQGAGAHTCTNIK